MAVAMFLIIVLAISFSMNVFFMIEVRGMSRDNYHLKNQLQSLQNYIKVLSSDVKEARGKK